MGKSKTRREAEAMTHREVLQRRRDFLNLVIERDAPCGSFWDKREAAALDWALEQLD